MAIKYEISRWDFPTSMQARAYHAVSRSDAAENRLWAEIYAMLESAALLDRPVAKRLEAEFEACEVSPPARGYLRRQTFKLSDDGARVEFFVTRI